MSLSVRPHALPAKGHIPSSPHWSGTEWTQVCPSGQGETSQGMGQSPHLPPLLLTSHITGLVLLPVEIRSGLPVDAQGWWWL